MLAVLAIIAGTADCARQGSVMSMYPVDATSALQPSKVNAASLEKVILGANDFAFRLTEAALAENGDDNLLLSPFSVWLPFAALLNATSTEYREGLTAALGVSGIGEDEINQAVAQILFELTAPRDTVEGSYNPLKLVNTAFISKEFTLRRNFAQLFSDYE